MKNFQASCSSSHDTESDPRWKHDVFLSFRGDTRYNFTDNLHNALQQKGIVVFRDKESVETGDEIWPTIAQAIEQSKVSIVVFSKHYASSTWCLNELVRILECKKAKGQDILPIFYDVDPTEVRHQKGSFRLAMEEHERKFKHDIEKVQKWGWALHEAANLSGLHYKNEYESQFIGRIVEKVSSILQNVPALYVAKYPVGLDSRVTEITSRLHMDSKDNSVKMLGIYGISGVGKTTLAKAVYNVIAHQFGSAAFIFDVRKKSKKDGLVSLQKDILTDLLEMNNFKFNDVDIGIPILKRRLSHQKVLLILDDVDNSKQLEALAGDEDWFGHGSRVIITSTNKDLLKQHGVEMCEARELDDHDSLELFCLNAFKKRIPVPCYEELAKRVVAYAKGIPIALEIIGADLFDKTVEEWTCTLNKYVEVMRENIFDVLQVSYNNLGYYEKQIFLDIAFFFNGVSYEGYVKRILEKSNFYPTSGIRKLHDKCLLKVEDGKLQMHDLLESMGKEIVRRESELEPSERSRLFHNKDVLQVISRDEGTSKIQGIVLDLPPEKEVQWSGQAFKKMPNLRILIIRKASFSKPPEYLPNSLILLEWQSYSWSSLPSDFNGKDLLVLKLQQVQPMQLGKQLKGFGNLTHISFRGCDWLTQVPDVSGIPLLRGVDVAFCENLVELHDSIGKLPYLEEFLATGCYKLKAFPPAIRLPSLKCLRLRGCQSITSIPDVSHSESIYFLDLSNTSIDMESTSARHTLEEFLYCSVLDLRVPGERIPKYFHHRTNGGSLSFLIRGIEVPHILIGFVFRYDGLKLPCKRLLKISIDGCESCFVFSSSSFCAMWFISFLPLLETYILEREWVHVELSCIIQFIDHNENIIRTRTPVECGAYVGYTGQIDEVITFTNPHLQDRNTDPGPSNYRTPEIEDTISSIVLHQEGAKDTENIEKCYSYSKITTCTPNINVVKWRNKLHI